MTNPPVGPRFRLAPGTVLRGGRSFPLPATPPSRTPTGAHVEASPEARTDTSSPPFRNTRWDRAALAVSIDPVWLLAPLFTRDAAGLHPGGEVPGPIAPAILRVAVTDLDHDAASSDWSGWWEAALAFRPGTPAPRPDDLFAGSRSLQRLWADLAGPFRRWVTSRRSDPPAVHARARAVEREALASFARSNGREPGRWTVRILQIPVSGHYLHSPEPRRVVVSAALRSDPAAYAAALAAELPHHF